MYKVFINDRPIFFLPDKEALNNYSFSGTYLVFTGDELDKLLEIIHQTTTETQALCMINQEVDQTYNRFRKAFKTVEAAGGVILNQHKEMLWIKRLGKWDLPKGKMEYGESKAEAAKREVEEECGIELATTLSYLCTSRHIYQQQGQWILKPTYWFYGQISTQQELIPQQEEGITDVQWIAQAQLAEPLSNTYASIKDVAELFTRNQSHNGV